VVDVKLRMQLVKDGEVIFEMPLFPADWPRKRLERELSEFETDLNRFSKIFAALSNKTRLLMMKKLLEEEDRTINFAVFMRDLDLNPKLVWDNSRILREGGLLRKVGRGKYRFSEFGESCFMMMSFALGRLMRSLEEEYGR
jgi:hypothetical protein